MIQSEILHCTTGTFCQDNREMLSSLLGGTGCKERGDLWLVSPIVESSKTGMHCLKQGLASSIIMAAEVLPGGMVFS